MCRAMNRCVCGGGGERKGEESQLLCFSHFSASSALLRSFASFIWEPVSKCPGSQPKEPSAAGRRHVEQAGRPPPHRCFTVSIIINDWCLHSFPILLLPSRLQVPPQCHSGRVRHPRPACRRGQGCCRATGQPQGDRRRRYERVWRCEGCGVSQGCSRTSGQPQGDRRRRCEGLKGFTYI